MNTETRQELEALATSLEEGARRIRATLARGEPGSPSPRELKCSQRVVVRGRFRSYTGTVKEVSDTGVCLVQDDQGLGWWERCTNCRPL